MPEILGVTSGLPKVMAWLRWFIAPSHKTPSGKTTLHVGGSCCSAPPNQTPDLSPKIARPGALELLHLR
jgi:hypothetical protein